jgi:hypothetical protein
MDVNRHSATVEVPLPWPDLELQAGTTLPEPLETFVTMIAKQRLCMK